MTRPIPLIVLFVAALAACSSRAETDEPAAAADEAEQSTAGAPEVTEPQPEGRDPVRTNADGSRLFGRELDEAREVVPLATVIGDPSPYAGQTIKTEGVISQVCQRMGCWMELRPTADEGPSVRVPMAGHSFFLPRDVSGRPATVQGTVEVQALDEGTREHLREEGAQATEQPISIVATAVLVR
jgi:hypothetical protein